jgi:hypothetical protein
MIANVSPSVLFIGDTLATLKFAQRAKARTTLITALVHTDPWRRRRSRTACP